MADHSVTVVGHIVKNDTWRWIREGNFYFVWYPESRLPDEGYVRVTGTLRNVNINHSARELYLDIDTIDKLEPLES